MDGKLIMGYSTSARYFYGVHIPTHEWTDRWADAEGERLDPVIHAVADLAPDVMHLTAGEYDQDMLFLVIHRPGFLTEVPIGEFVKIVSEKSRDLGWDAQLTAVVQAMGYKDVDSPGWIFLPDVS